MLLENTKDHDFIFNMDSGGSVKGQQFRTPIRANSTASISIIQMFMLMLNGNFQGAINDGSITAVYDSWHDFWTCVLIDGLLDGWL